MQVKQHDYLLSLYDLYRELLTEKQRAYFEAYFFLDLSISEIANDYNLSRNAIFDQLKKVEEKLIDYENKLKLQAKYTNLVDVIQDEELYNKVIDCLKEW